MKWSEFLGVELVLQNTAIAMVLETVIETNLDPAIRYEQEAHPTDQLFFFCRCRARLKLRRSSILLFRLSIPTHENISETDTKVSPKNNKNTKLNPKQTPTKTQKPTGHQVKEVKHYAFSASQYCSAMKKQIPL